MWIAICYFIANINGAYMVAKWKKGADIRTLGSGTGGARNAGRVLGKPAFVWTVVIDALKVTLPLSLILYLTASPIIIGFSVIALITGHIWPLLLKGRGGKGIVVYLAVLLMLEPLGLLLFGFIAFIASITPMPFSKVMIAAMAIPPLLTIWQGDLWVGLCLGIGYCLVVIAHTLPVHPRLSIKEEQI
ncbi:glycerol-3-phosphate acyltransferase [Halobacillus sp. K22]|uniref:glycerol-3-phosphate acyltransferase n=1 Tax=Halobacillus sp. K22 TaxID=3457431 RepID=UPI003FCE1B06